MLFTLPEGYRPSNQYFQRQFITGAICAQCIIDSSGEIRFSYAANISGTTITNVDIASGSAVRFEAAYVKGN